jgi:hypothetical protein
MISEQEYKKLISIARSRFPNCYEDVVHDAVLLGVSFDECAKRLKGLSFNYFTVNEVDLTDKYEEKVCIKCNKCFPISCFGIYKIKNITSTRNVCLSCNSVSQKNSYSKWVKSNREHLTKYQKKYHKEYYKNNKEQMLEYGKQWRENNKEYVTEYAKKWRSENSDYRKEYFKEWYAKNKKKKNDYTSRYRAKKKLEKLTFK